MRPLFAKALAVTGILALSVGCATFGGEVAFKDQWPLYEALRTSSAIIFAVIGAWVSVLYPNALQKVFSRNRDFGERDASSLKLMLSNIRVSSLILGFVMITGLIAPLAKQVQFCIENAESLRRLSFGVVGALTYLQLWTLLMTIAQAEIAKDEIDVGVQKTAYLDKVLSRTKQLPKQE